MVLPSAWRDRLGKLETTGKVTVETAPQETVEGEFCGPVRIEVEGFRPIHSEVLFLDMKPANGAYEPLVGYIVLEQCQAALDMLGRRLIPAKPSTLSKQSLKFAHKPNNRTCNRDTLRFVVAARHNRDRCSSRAVDSLVAPSQHDPPTPASKVQSYPAFQCSTPVSPESRRDKP
jgi:hypothetical protein